jgi:hypothetical protein
MEAFMKRLFYAFILAFCLSLPSFTNPITPQSLITEVYFEGDEWFLVVENYVLEIFGIVDFQEIEFFSSDGVFIFKEDFLPDFGEEFTIITNDALIYPVQLHREMDHIYTFWIGGYNYFMPLEWGNNYSYRVFGPNPGQSLILRLVYENNYFNPEFWLCKSNDPYLLGGDGKTWGIFEGYLYDQNNNPVANAELRYVDDNYFDPPWWFYPVITNQNGYFYKDYMDACNYHIQGIVIDSTEYEFDEYISIEPDSVNTFNFSMVITQIAEIEKNAPAKISCFPNPFTDRTTFTINIDKDHENSNMQIIISEISGRTISIIPLNEFEFKNKQLKIPWANTNKLHSGLYLISLSVDGAIAATTKISIE